MSYVVILTGAQRIVTKSPIYYKIELDLIYKARGPKGSAQSALEQAIENYKLMMGREELTPIEHEIIVMLMERQEIAANLTPTCLRMRRARFFMRRLMHVEYRTLGSGEKVKLLVSPLTFLFQVFNSGTFSQSYDHYRVLDLKQRVEKELRCCTPLEDTMIDALEQARKR